MSREQVEGIVRHILTFGSGFIVAKGWVNESVALEIVTLGAGIAGLVWSFLAKR